MKEIVIVGTAYPFRGGLASYNERLARAFSEAGHKVRIYTFKLQYPSFLFPGKTQYSESPPPEDLNIEVIVNSINPFNWIKIGKRIRKEAPDILLIKFWLPFMGPCFGKVARIAKKNGKTKVISIIDNIIPHEKRMGDTALAKYFVKPVDGFIAMSRNVLEDLKKFDEKAPKVYSPHPLFDNFGEACSREEALQHLELDAQFRYLLFFGIIRKYKGLHLLLEAIADDAFRSKNVKVIVAGEFYSDEEFYKNMIRDLKLEDQIVLVDKFIADEDVYKYFCAADMIVQPYVSATQSGVTQIGYHFEKPMLVTDVGGLAELIPHQVAGYVTQPDPIEIRASLMDFYDNNRQAELEEGVRQEKKKFAWEIMVDKVIELAH